MAEGLKIIFAGTPEFAATILQALLDAGHDIVAVYTQPDRPAGRGRKLTTGPVKVLAQAHRIPVEQPVSLKQPSVQEGLAAWRADLMVVVAYGLILPKAVLQIPRLGCVNVHASLLPRWRGAAPIQRAILAGDKESGVTIMQMDEGLDTGDMLEIARCPIEAEDTAQTLHDKLAPLGAEALLRTLEQFRQHRVTATPQDDAQASYAEKLHKGEAQLDWRQAAQQLARQVRAFNPWPVAFTALPSIQGAPQNLRIWMAQAIDAASNAEPGEVLAESRHGIDVASGEGVLRITQLQLPGGKPLTAEQFLNAHSLLGQRLG
jgi:methionyl-tRNA formyltransferase